MNNVVQFGFFKLNQSNIESRLCINKSKPLKKCHGKCYLKKLLKERNDKKNQPSSLTFSSEQNLWIEPALANCNRILFEKSSFAQVPTIAFIDCSLPFDHPPRM
jgi:hypothetical protein